MIEIRAIRACAQVVDVRENIQASEANVRQVSDKANNEILLQQEEKQYPYCLNTSVKTYFPSGNVFTIYKSLYLHPNIWKTSSASQIA